MVNWYALDSLIGLITQHIPQANAIWVCTHFDEFI